MKGGVGGIDKSKKRMLIALSRGEKSVEFGPFQPFFLCEHLSIVPDKKPPSKKGGFLVLDSELCASLAAASLNHALTVLGCRTREETVCCGTLSLLRLIGSL